jgi:hypothetical protein
MVSVLHRFSITCCALAAASFALAIASLQSGAWFPMLRIGGAFLAIAFLSFQLQCYVLRKSISLRSGETITIHSNPLQYKFLFAVSALATIVAIYVLMRPLF